MTMHGRCWLHSVRCLLTLLCLGSLTHAFVGVSMYPEGSVFIVRGEPLAINCTITMSVNSSSVYNLSIVLREGSTGQRRDLANFSTFYPEMATVAVNIPETTIEDNGTYICYYNRKFKSLKVVRIGEMPEPPKSIRCVSLNFIQMTCYVELSQKDTNIPTNWTMEYRTRSLAETLPCTTYNASYLNCGNITGSSQFRIFANYSLTVIGISEDFNITLQNVTYIYTDYRIVKPGPVRDLKWIRTDNSSVIILHWKFPAQLGPAYISFIYRVNVRAENDWDTRVLFVDTIASNPDVEHVYSYALNGLVPYTNYTVSLSAKPVTSLGDWYWSEPETVRLTTDSDVPGASVSILKGSYYAQELGGHFISPVIYWKNPDRRLSHGQIAGYQLTISQIHSETAKPWSSTLEPATHNALPREVRGIMGYSEVDLRLLKVLNETGKRTYSVVHDRLLKNESYLVEVKAGTERGFSKATSAMVIPSWNKVKFLQSYRVIAELDEDSRTAVISWQTSQNISCEIGLQQTVYWCTVDKSKGNHSYVLCQDDLDWQTVNITDRCTNMTQDIRLTTDKDLGSIKFGVSLAINGVSAGIQWESCRFDAVYHVPDIPLYRVDPVEDKHTELQIKVLYENCYSRDGGKPTSYQVIYKQFAGEFDNVQCPEGAKLVSYPVDFDKPVMYLTNLDAGTQYVVCVRAINRYGSGSYGKSAVVRTSEPEKKNVTWIWVTFGVLPGALILIGLSVCFIRYWRRRMKPIEISDIPVSKDREGNFNYRKQAEGWQNGNGTDSGVDSHKSEQSSVNGPSESDVPIIAQQFSSSRKSRTPSLERKRKISPPLPGYQHIIHLGNDDIDYEECETSSLLDNEDPGTGIDNELNVEMTRPKHVYNDIEKHEENMERALEHDLGNDTEPGKSKIDYEIGTDRVNGRNENEQDRTEETATSVISDKTIENPVNQEYVEEGDMQKLAAKQSFATCSKIDYSVAAKTFNEEKTLNSVDDTLTGVPLEVFTRTILKPLFGVTNSDIDNDHTNGNLDKGMKPNSSVIEYHDEITAADEKFSEFHDDKSNKTHEIMRRNPLPNGINLKSILNEKDDNAVHQTKPVQLNTYDSNTVNVMNDTENCEDYNHSLSDVDHFDDDDEFNPTLGCGDGELTEILEALTNCRNVPKAVDLGPYVDHDQISICSFVSNASSLQDRATPEKRVGARQGSEHSSVAASPVLPHVAEKIAIKIEPKTVLEAGDLDVLETCLKKGVEVHINGTTFNRNHADVNNSIAVPIKLTQNRGENKEVEQIEADKHANENSKEVGSDRNVVQNGMESGGGNISLDTSSGTGVSSYVHVTAAGDPVERDRNDQQTHL